VGTVAAVVAVVFLIVQVWLQHLALKRDEVVYRNPLVIRQVKTLRVEGPVRILTRTVREPGGREEVLREETRGAVTEASDSSVISQPVFAPAGAAGGWQIAPSLQPLHRFERGAWALWGGYSFGGRLDLMAGLRGNGRVETMAIWRFKGRAR
jgi:hypothetical protein